MASGPGIPLTDASREKSLPPEVRLSVSTGRTIFTRKSGSRIFDNNSHSHIHQPVSVLQIHPGCEPVCLANPIQSAYPVIEQQARPHSVVPLCTGVLHQSGALSQDQALQWMKQLPDVQLVDWGPLLQTLDSRVIMVILWQRSFRCWRRQHLIGDADWLM